MIRHSKSDLRARKVVLGLGNPLFKDEGFGIHAVQTAQAVLGDQEGIEWIDGGVLGMDLLPLVEDCSHLLVLDAIDAGQPPGTVIELRGDQIPMYAGIKMSEHQFGFQEVLGLACFRGLLPTCIHMIGVQPAGLVVDLNLSPEVSAALPEVLERVRAVIHGWDTTIMQPCKPKAITPSISWQAGKSRA